MSRTTTVGSPTTVPMTRLSPAGTVVAQCTSEAGPLVGVDAGVLPAEGDADAVAGVAVALGEP
jgi:hypothetical protein